jgi:hypothetical protein
MSDGIGHSGSFQDNTVDSLLRKNLLSQEGNVVIRCDSGIKRIDTQMRGYGGVS